jgi:hypothetical protein
MHRLTLSSGTHRAIEKREAQAATVAVNTTSAPSTAATSATPAANADVSAAARQQCAPTPSALCTCPAKSINAACSSLVPSRPTTIITTTSTTTVKCPKDTITVTVTKKDGKVVATTTMTVYPGPDISYSTEQTLTTTVPAACAGPAYYPSDNGIGDTIVLLDYPYFPQTAVECCVLCYDPAFPNCVASAYIEGSGTCELLIKVDQLAGAPTSPQCPLGIENYHFADNDGDGGTGMGSVYAGPCGY